MGKIEYNNEFNRNNYDRISLIIPKGAKLTLRGAFRAKGYKSLNQYITCLIEADLGVRIWQLVIDGGGRGRYKKKGLRKGSSFSVPLLHADALRCSLVLRLWRASFLWLFNVCSGF